jgi:predicted Zn-dependent protease
MIRWLIAIGVALLLIAGAYLAFWNQDPVVLHLGPDQTTSAPLASALLVAFAVGVGLMGLVMAARASTRGWRTWRGRRVARRQAHEVAATARARDLLHTGDATRARLELLRVTGDVPQDVPRLALLAETHLAEGDPVAARTVVEQGLARDGAEPRLLTLLATAAVATRDFRTATGALERARRADPENPGIARRLRDAYVAEGRWTDALALQGDILLHLQSPAALATEERALRFLRYQVALQEPDARLAARALMAIARENPTFVGAWVAAGDRWEQAGRLFTARRAWERGARRRPALVLLDRIERHNATARHPERTARFLRRLQRRHPDALVVPLALARHLVAEGRFDAATEVLGALPEAQAARPEALRLWGELYRRQGDTQRAADAFARAAGTDLGLGAPYRCASCRRSTERWEAYCPSCRQWDTMRAATEWSPSA